MVNPSAKNAPEAIADATFPGLPVAYLKGELCLDGVSLERIAGEFGTPTYVYSANTILTALRSYQAGLGKKGRVFFAVKSCSNLAILRLLCLAGAGVDIVSGGELARALEAGFPGSAIVFSGVGKTEAEIEAALAADILFFVVESAAELATIERLALREECRARISIRINPDIAAETHPYIATGLGTHKFGVPLAEVEGLYSRAVNSPALEPVALGFHIGSQILSGSAHLEAARLVTEFALRLKERLKLNLRYLDIGGGLGIAYDGGRSPEPREFIEALRPVIESSGLDMVVEPGRSIVGNAGLLLTRILYRKSNGTRQFLICDAGMNDLLRPALYQAEHEVWSLKESTGLVQADLVGPVCESGDFLARQRLLPDSQPGEGLAVLSAGAYGFVMSSQYNSRPRAAEVLVFQGKSHLIRRRETIEDLLAPELGLFAFLAGQSLLP